jgi:opacity protein-like surface antigen
VQKTIHSLIAVACIAAAASAAQAQSYNPFQIGASGGVALPNGDLGSGTNTGYNIALVVGYKPQFSPLGIRGEAAYNQFGFDGGGGNINIPAFTGNVEYAIPIGSSFTPYAIGGAGLYRPSVDLGGGNSGAENHFGWNVGGGIRLPFTSSFETFIEARYNSVSVNGGTLSFVPITFGVLF